MSETPDIETKLKAVREARAALGNVREVEQTPAQILAREEQALVDDKAIADAVAKYGPLGRSVAIVETDEGTIVVRAPNPILFRRFQDETRESGATVDALEKLVRPSLVHPASAKFDAILEVLPFALTRCGDAVCALAGVRKGRVEAKF
jgi:adenylate kinase